MFIRKLLKSYVILHSINRRITRLYERIEIVFEWWRIMCKMWLVSITSSKLNTYVYGSSQKQINMKHRKTTKNYVQIYVDKT